MKKIILSIFIFTIFCCIYLKYYVLHYKNESTPWTYVNKEIYINTNTIQKENIYWCGWFRKYKQKQNDYEEIKYCASCDDNKILDIAHFKKFENNILIKDEINKYQVTGNFEAYVDGKLYYNSICNGKKN